LDREKVASSAARSVSGAAANSLGGSCRWRGEDPVDPTAYFGLLPFFAGFVSPSAVWLPSGLPVQDGAAGAKENRVREKAAPMPSSRKEKKA